MIQLSHIYKTYDADKHALRDVSLHIDKNDFIFLTGPSGAGKTTLFRVISAQEKPTVGSYSFDEKNVLQFSTKDLILFRRSIGVIFQDFKLIPEMTILENIELPLSIQGQPKKERLKKATEIAETLNLKEILKSYPDYLSGGEKQRVAVARTLIHQPKLIIADEPTGNLDKDNSISVLSMIKNYSIRNEVPVLIATHDESLIRQFGNRSIQLQSGQISQDSSL